MEMPSSRRVGFGILLIGITLAAICWSWLKTRKLVPLDVPISLARGHLKSHQFNLNLDSGYYIEIEVSRTQSLDRLDCLMWGCYDTPAVIDAHWALSVSGQIELVGSSKETNGASGSLGTVGRVIGYFRSSGGHYTVDVDLLSDASALNIGNPRLKVEADGEGYNRLGRLYDRLFVVPGLLVIIGATLVLLGTGKNAEVAAEVPPGHTSGLPKALFYRFQRGAPISGLPHFSLIATFVLLLVLVPLWIVTFWHAPSKGLWVLLSERDRKLKASGSLLDPLVLHIDQQQCWFLNGNPVLPENLPSALRQALSRRDDWFVYLDADPTLSFEVPARAIDIVRNSQARVILATPNTRNMLAPVRTMVPALDSRDIHPRPSPQSAQPRFD